MFEVGFSELLLIMALALLVLGPQKLPKVVAEVGRWMGRARRIPASTTARPISDPGPHPHPNPCPCPYPDLDGRHCPTEHPR